MMDRNEVEGTLRNAAGHIQDVAGALTGDLESQAKGKGKQISGNVQAEYGDVLDTVREKTVERPVGSLAVAGLVGFLLGVLWARRD